MKILRFFHSMPSLKNGVFISLMAAAFPLFGGEYVFFSPEAVQSHLRDYNALEKRAVEQDLAIVRAACERGGKEDSFSSPVYLATAGAPGARKSTILERFLESHGEFANLPYYDPDQRGLKFMVHTYYAQSLSAANITKYNDYMYARKAAYTKWRGASNYIALTLLEEAFSQKRSVAHGTTSTGAHIPCFLQKVKNAGYEVVLLLCSCEDALKKQAIEYRNQVQKFYQSTPEDSLKKAKLFPERMSAYFSYADTLHLFWSDDLETQERLAAIFSNGKIEVVDEGALEKFQQKFEKDRNRLEKEGKKIPSWSNLLNLYHHRFS